MANRNYIILEDKNGKEVLPVTDGNGVFVEGGTKKLENKLIEIDSKTTELNEQLDTNANNLEYVKISNFGTDFNAFKNAINYCKTNNKNLNIDIDLTLNNVTQIDIDFNIKIITNKSKIKFDNTLLQVVKNGKLEIDILIIDLAEQMFQKIADVRKGGVLIVRRTEFKNFHNTSVSKSCVMFNIENGSFTLFDDIIIENIKTIGNKTITDAIGEQRFIRTTQNKEGENCLGSTIIKNIKVTDFYNIDEMKQAVEEDSDIIVFQHGLSATRHMCIVENIQGVNIGKRMIKVQSPNVSINNVKLDNSEFNSRTTVVSIQTGADNVNVHNIEINADNNNTRAIETFGCKNITIDDVVLNISEVDTKSGCAFNIAGENITISNVKGKVKNLVRFFNPETKNITLKDFSVKVDSILFVYEDFNNNLFANIVIEGFNIEYAGQTNVKCVLFKNNDGNILHNVFFRNCNMRLNTSHEYGVLHFENIKNVRFDKCEIDTLKRGTGVSFKDCDDIFFYDSKIDRATANNSKLYWINSNLESIRSIGSANEIMFSSLIKTPEVQHTDGSSDSVLRKPYNIQ